MFIRKWADYSFARPDLGVLKAAGVTGVFRYLAPLNSSTSGKIITPSERDALLHAGFDIALNFEWYEGRCNEGANAGTADAETALAQAGSLKYPGGKCIYFSHDTGVYNWSNIEAYFRSVRFVFGTKYKIGAYGSAELIAHLHSLGLIDYGWQTLAWSNGVRDPWAVVYQDGGASVAGTDNDVVSSADIGSWLDGPGVVAVTVPSGAQWNDVQSKVDLEWVDIPKIVTLCQDIDKRVAQLQSSLSVLSGQVAALNLPAVVAGSGASGKDLVTALAKALQAGESSV
jgi:hypothetical protein